MIFVLSLPKNCSFNSIAVALENAKNMNEKLLFSEVLRGPYQYHNCRFFDDCEHKLLKELRQLEACNLRGEPEATEELRLINGGTCEYHRYNSLEQALKSNSDVQLTEVLAMLCARQNLQLRVRGTTVAEIEFRKYATKDHKRNFGFLFVAAKDSVAAKYKALAIADVLKAALPGIKHIISTPYAVIVQELLKDDSN